MVPPGEAAPAASLAELWAAFQAGGAAFLDLQKMRIMPAASLTDIGPCACLAGDLRLVPGQLGTPSQVCSGPLPHPLVLRHTSHDQLGFTRPWPCMGLHLPQMLVSSCVQCQLESAPLHTIFVYARGALELRMNRFNVVRRSSSCRSSGTPGSSCTTTGPAPPTSPCTTRSPWSRTSSA